MDQPATQPFRTVTLVRWLAVSALSVLLLYWSGSWFQNYRDAVTRDFNATSNLWRWFLASFLVVAVGLGVGLAVRGWPLAVRGFDWKTTVVMGSIPLFAAMSMPATIWNWPGATPSSSIGAMVRAFFNNPEPAWLLVGIAIAMGFQREAADRKRPAHSAVQRPAAEPSEAEVTPIRSRDSRHG